MNVNRKFNMVIGGFLGTVLFITTLFFGSQQVAQGNDRLSPRVGEAPGLENRSLPVDSPNSSMGNLRRYEKQQQLLVSAPAVLIGFGDLHQYENQLEALSKAQAVPSGMGDVRRFESGR